MKKTETLLNRIQQLAEDSNRYFAHRVSHIYDNDWEVAFKHPSGEIIGVCGFFQTKGEALSEVKRIQMNLAAKIEMLAQKIQAGA